MLAAIFFYFDSDRLSAASAPLPAEAIDPREGQFRCDARLRFFSARAGKKIESGIAEWHNPDLLEVEDFEICFEGYVSDFDDDDDDDQDGEPDNLGVPHAVVYRVDGRTGAPESRARPSTWFSVKYLVDQGLAPTHRTYTFPRKWRDSHPDWYERGHLAQKYVLERLSADAGKFSHNMVNAVPQRGAFNKTAWNDLECRVGGWARKYKEVWVITGPIFENPAIDWLDPPRGKDPPAAIPDSMFKIVVRREDGGSYKTLAFQMPQKDPSYADGDWDLSKWATSIDRIEKQTGLKFFPKEPDSAALKAVRITQLWPLRSVDLDPSCRKFARHLQ